MLWIAFNILFAGQFIIAFYLDGVSFPHKTNPADEDIEI